MLKCLIYVQITSKNRQKLPYLDIHFNIFFHEIIRINIELNFTLISCLKNYGKILKFPRKNSEFGRYYFLKHARSKRYSS